MAQFGRADRVAGQRVARGSAGGWCPSTRGCPPNTHGGHMRYWWALLLAAVFLVILVVHPSGQRCVRVNALGYDGEKGVLIPITFCTIPGNGGVFLSADRVYGEGFQSALQTAVAVFKGRYDVSDRSIIIRVGGAPEYFDGRSVALAMYAGLFASAFGYDPSRYAFTGDLASDGSVLPVAYVREKATAFNGSVVVPLGNCGDGLVCVSSVSDVERIITSKRV